MVWITEGRLSVDTPAIAAQARGSTILTRTKWLFCKLIDIILGIVCKKAGKGLTS